MANYELGNLVWRITGDDSGLRKSVKRSDKQVSGFSSTLKKMAVAVGGAFAVRSVVRFGKHILQLASDAEETRNMFNVVFSDINEQASNAAQNLQENYALTAEASERLLASTADLLQGFGMAQDESLALSEEAAKLGADLASYTNFAGGAEGATEALTSAMLGERERLKQLQIALTETDLKEFAADQGVAWDEADRGTKAMLTLKAAAAQSGNAIGDLERSYDSYANVQRRINRRMDDMSVELGKELLPAMNDLGLAFLEATKDGGVLAEMFSGLTNLVSSTVNALSIFITTLDSIQPAKDAEEANEVLRMQQQRYSEITKQLVALKKAGKENTAEYEVLNKKLKARELMIEEAMKITSSHVDELKTKADLIENIKNKTEEEKQAIVDSYNKRKQEREQNKKSSDESNESLTELEKHARDYALKLGEADIAWQKQNDSIQQANDLMQGFGSQLMGIFSAASELSSALYDKRLEQLDAQMEAELEAAGLSEQTAVEKAQAELDAAKKSGKAEEIEEKKKQLAKAKIEEKYQKKRAELEYQSELSSWKWRKTEATAGVPLAIMNALASGWAAGPVMGPILGPLYASMAGAAAIMQLAAVNAAKPEPPKFATGGIVPGNQRTGDNMLIRANSREMVLNEAQQSRLLNIADGGGGGNNMRKVAPISREMTWQEIFDASQRGELFISERAIQRT